jgi:mono/diheme cytochrome c family protein
MTRTSTLAVAVAVMALAGCYRQDMARQPKYHWPDAPSDFFSDRSANRPLEAGTVARGHLRADDALYSGRQPGETGAAPKYLTEFPFPITAATLARGRERFNIYCAICHGRAGYGDGKVVQRGYAKPPSLHDQRLRDIPVGRVFEVITQGFGAMPEYAEMIPPNDRWAIVGYVRALQLSQNVPAGELTPQDREHLPAGGERGQR